MLVLTGSVCVLGTCHQIVNGRCLIFPSASLPRTIFAAVFVWGKLRSGSFVWLRKKLLQGRHVPGKLPPMGSSTAKGVQHVAAVRGISMISDLAPSMPCSIHQLLFFTYACATPICIPAIMSPCIVVRPFCTGHVVGTDGSGLHILHSTGHGGPRIAHWLPCAGNTTGYVAMGISDISGRMGPADVVFGWVENGTAALSDRQTLSWNVSRALQRMPAAPVTAPLPPSPSPACPYGGHGAHAHSLDCPGLPCSGGPVPRLRSGGRQHSGWEDLHHLPPTA